MMSLRVDTREIRWVFIVVFSIALWVLAIFNLNKKH